MDSQTIADEIRGLITLGLLDEVREIVDGSNLDDPTILAAARRFYVAVEDWELAGQAGLRLLNYPEQRTWLTAHNTALALHQVGRTAQAALLLYHYPPDDSAYERSFHFYSLTTYLATLGRYRAALGALHVALRAESRYWCKAFVDHDLRGLWQWLGDLKSSDEELSAILGDSLWIEVLAGVATSTQFTLDPSDLKLHPKLRSLVRFHPSRAVYVPRHDIGPRGRRVLHEWLRSRSRWATRRLRSAIVRATSDASAEPAKTGALTPSEIFDHLEKTALSKKPELAAKQKRLLNILKQQQQN